MTPEEGSCCTILIRADWQGTKKEQIKIVRHRFRLAFRFQDMNSDHQSDTRQIKFYCRRISLIASQQRSSSDNSDMYSAKNAVSLN